MAVSKSKGTEPLISHHFNNIKYGNTASDKEGRVQSVFSRQVNHPKLNKGKPTLIPSVYNGKVLTEEEAVQAAIDSGVKWTSANSHEDLREYDIQIHERMSASLGEKTDREAFNKGGTMALQEQMSMFDEGGMLDEGDTVDPVSGNDVPVGALKEEVRDDVPANVSPGEFVVSAATVRFHGLDKFMKLRDEAMQGMARMEAIGQMGNSDSAELDPDTPFSQEDLVIVMGGPPEEGMPSDDKPMEANRGGSVLPTAAELGEEDPQELMYADGGAVNPSLVDRSLNLRREEGFQALVPKFDRVVEYVNGQGERTFVSLDTNGNPMGYVDPDSRPVDASSRAAKDSKDTDVYNTSNPSNTFVRKVDEQPRGPDDNKIEAPDFGDGSWDINFVKDNGEMMTGWERVKKSFEMMVEGAAQHTGEYDPVTGAPIFEHRGGFVELSKSLSPVLDITPEAILGGIIGLTDQGVGAYIRKEFERGPELTIQREWKDLTGTEKDELKNRGIEETNYDKTRHGLVARFPGEDIREDDAGLGVQGRDYLENLDPISELDIAKEIKNAEALPRTSGEAIVRAAEEKAQKLTEQFKNEMYSGVGAIPVIPSYIGRGTDATKKPNPDYPFSSDLEVIDKTSKETGEIKWKNPDGGPGGLGAPYEGESKDNTWSRNADGTRLVLSQNRVFGSGPDTSTQIQSIQDGLRSSDPPKDEVDFTTSSKAPVTPVTSTSLDPVFQPGPPKNILPTPLQSKEIDRQIKIANEEPTAISPPKQDFTKVPTEDLLERLPMGTPPQPELDIAGDITRKTAGPTGGTYEPPVASRNTDPILETNFPPGQGPQPEAIPVTRSIGAPLSKTYDPDGPKRGLTPLKKNTTEEKSATPSWALSAADRAIVAPPRQDATVTTGALSPALQEAIDIANNTYGPGHMAIPAGVVPTKQQLEWLMGATVTQAAWDTIAEKQARENHAKGILSANQLARELKRIGSTRRERAKPSKKDRIVRDPRVKKDDLQGGAGNDTLAGKTSFSPDYDVPDRDPFGYGDPAKEYEGGKSELDYSVEEEDYSISSDYDLPEDPYENYDPMGSTDKLLPDRPPVGGTADTRPVGDGVAGLKKGGLITRKKYNRGGSVTDNTLNLYEGSLINTSLGNRKAKTTSTQDISTTSSTDASTNEPSFDYLNPEVRNLKNPFQGTLAQKHAQKNVGKGRAGGLDDRAVQHILRKHNVEWTDEGSSQMDWLEEYRQYIPGSKRPIGLSSRPDLLAQELDGVLGSRMIRRKPMDMGKNPGYMTIMGRSYGLTVEEAQQKYGKDATMGDVLRAQLKPEMDMMIEQAGSPNGSYGPAVAGYNSFFAKGKEDKWLQYTTGSLYDRTRGIDLNKKMGDADIRDMADIRKSIFMAMYGKLPRPGYMEPLTEIARARPDKWGGFKRRIDRIKKQYPLWEDPRLEVTANKGALIQKPKKNKAKAKSKRRGLASASY